VRDTKGDLKAVEAVARSLEVQKVDLLTIPQSPPQRADEVIQ